MSEYEYFQAVALATEAVGFNFSILSTVLVAYVAAGHIVAKGLPKNIAIGATFAYSLIMIGPLLSYAAWFNSAFELTTQYFELYPEGRVLTETLPRFLHISLFTVPAAVLYLSSIYYVHFHIRKDKPSDDDT